MKIVIADGGHAADYVLQNFKGKGHELIVINPDKETANKLATHHNIDVYCGSPYRKFVLQEANAQDADIFLALGHEDSDNFVSCLLAKKAFGAKKVICIVYNPKNVDLFRDLGIDSVISSTALLTDSIISESSLETLTHTMAIENNSVVLVETVVKPNYVIAHKKLMEIDFPKTGTVSCIYRKPRAIIPNGQTTILPKDKLIIITTPEEKDNIIKFVQTVEEVKK